MLTLRPFVESHKDKINWLRLSANPAAIHLLEANLDEIWWDELSQNPAAIHLLETNPNKIDWSSLSVNPVAIHLLDANPDKINWGVLSLNSAIFTYDYVKIKQHMFESGIAEGIIANRMHPRHVDKWDDWGIGFDE